MAAMWILTARASDGPRIPVASPVVPAIPKRRMLVGGIDVWGLREPRARARGWIDVGSRKRTALVVMDPGRAVHWFDLECGERERFTALVYAFYTMPTDADVAGILDELVTRRGVIGDPAAFAATRGGRAEGFSHAKGDGGALESPEVLSALIAWRACFRWADSVRSRAPRATKRRDTGDPLP